MKMNPFLKRAGILAGSFFLSYIFVLQYVSQVVTSIVPAQYAAAASATALAVGVDFAIAKFGKKVV